MWKFGKSWCSKMSFNKLVQEIYDTNINKTYTATSSAPRKDFAPVSSKDGYHYPYQQNPLSPNDSANQPERLQSYPWELQNITDDLSNSFIYTAVVADKINKARKNPSINTEQKRKLKNIFNFSKKVLNAIKSIALEIENNIDISMQPTPEVKINSSQNNNPDSFNKTEVKIKLPKR